MPVGQAESWLLPTCADHRGFNPDLHIIKISTIKKGFVFNYLKYRKKKQKVFKKLTSSLLVDCVDAPAVSLDVDGMSLFICFCSSASSVLMISVVSVVSDPSPFCLFDNF